MGEIVLGKDWCTIRRFRSLFSLDDYDTVGTIMATSKNRRIRVSIQFHEQKVI